VILSVARDFVFLRTVRLGLLEFGTSISPTVLGLRGAGKVTTSSRKVQLDSDSLRETGPVEDEKAYVNP